MARKRAAFGRLFFCYATLMNWDADFAGLPPVKLPDGRRLETLADCSAYILALPEHEHARWEGVVAELLKAAEHGGPFRFHRADSLWPGTARCFGSWSPARTARSGRGLAGEASEEEAATMTLAGAARLNLYP
jgi:hypothetical protein